MYRQVLYVFQRGRRRCGLDDIENREENRRAVTLCSVDTELSNAQTSVFCSLLPDLGDDRAVA